MKKVIRMSMEDVYEQTGFCKSLEGDPIEAVDGSDIDRVLAELTARGGPDEIIADFLRDKLNEYWATVDPESCVGEE